MRKRSDKRKPALPKKRNVGMREYWAALDNPPANPRPELKKLLALEEKGEKALQKIGGVVAEGRKKLPEDLSDSAYRYLADGGKRALEMWRKAALENESALQKEARKRIRRAWEALFLPLDYRQRINLLDIWPLYYREVELVTSACRKLREVSSSRERIKEADFEGIAKELGLSEDELDDIWINLKSPRPHAKDRLAECLGLSPGRLNRLIPISRKLYRFLPPAFPFNKPRLSLLKS